MSSFQLNEQGLPELKGISLATATLTEQQIRTNYQVIKEALEELERTKQIDLSAMVNIIGDRLKIGAKDGGNYSSVEQDGTIVFEGEALVWRDIDFPLVIRTTGADVPVLQTLQGNITAPQWDPGDFNVCEGQEFVHAWAEGTEASWHIHLITNGQEAVDKYVTFSVEWFWVKPDAQISASDTKQYEFKIPANTPTKTMLIVPIYVWTPTAGKIGGHCYARLKRETSASAAPIAHPWCTMLQLHIKCDTVGSREKTEK